MLLTEDGRSKCMEQHGKLCNWTLTHAVSCHVRHKGDHGGRAARIGALAVALAGVLDAMGVRHEHLVLPKALGGDQSEAGTSTHHASSLAGGA